MAPIQRVFPGFALIFFAALWAVVFGALAVQPAAAQNGRLGTSGLSLPRFVSLKSGEVNLRTGPGKRYPIDWIYRRRGLPVEVIQGNKVVEIRCQGIDKGALVQHILRQHKDHYMILCFGDDRTDEEMFAALPPRAWTCRIGDRVTQARYFLNNPEETKQILSKLSELG